MFQHDFHLVYESQVPNTGIVLLDGKVTLFKKRKPSSTVLPGTMLGVYELLNNHPANQDWMVAGNSELILLQKSDILDALSDKSSELYGIIKGNLFI